MSLLSCWPQLSTKVPVPRLSCLVIWGKKWNLKLEE